MSLAVACGGDKDTDTDPATGTGTGTATGTATGTSTGSTDTYVTVDLNEFNGYYAGEAAVVIDVSYDGYEAILTEDADTGEVLCDFQMPGVGIPHVDDGDACTDFDGNPCLFSFDVTFDTPGAQESGSRTCAEFGWYDGDTWGLTFGYGYVDDYMYSSGGYGPRFMYQYGGAGYTWYYTFYTDVTWTPDSGGTSGTMTYAWFYGSDFYVP